MALFLLPGGRPRRFGVGTSAIHAGGRPRRRPRPRASRSRLTIASSNWSRSDFNSARILSTSISLPPPGRPQPHLPPRPKCTLETLTPWYITALPNFHLNISELQGPIFELKSQILTRKVLKLLN